MPVQYAGIVAEHTAVRERAGLFDVSHMGRLEVTGNHALQEVNRLITNDLERIPDGRAVYACCCNDEGGILDDLIVYRYSSTRLLVICNAANHKKIAAHFGARLGAGSTLHDISRDTGLLALQGPQSIAIAEVLGLSAATKLSRFSFCEAELCGVSVVIARTGYTGEDGFEIVVPSAQLVSAWRTVLAAGGPAGLVPVGLGARDTLRLEACLSLYGHELDEATHPLEAGLAFAVKLDKHDFIGKAALAKAKSEPARRKLVGLTMVGRGIARENYPIVDSSHKVIGKVTSGAPGPTVGKNIGLAYVPVASSAIGTRLLVDCRGMFVEAEVSPIPFHKRV
jgi:aminomethyltransferase